MRVKGSSVILGAALMATGAVGRPAGAATGGGEKAPAAEVGPATEAGEAAAAGAAGRAEIRQRGPAREGALGVDEVLSADPGPAGTYRLRLSLVYADADDFPIEGHGDTFAGGRLALAVTPLPYLEVFLSARNTTNVNRGSQPSLLQTQGDLDLGLKGGAFVSDVVAVGAAAGARVASGLGSTGPGDAAVSFHLRGLGTFDLARADRAPLRIHLNVGYYRENSESVAEGHPEDLDLIQEWGLQIARYDRITFGLALEVPFSPYVAPYLEYRLDTPLEVKLARRPDDAAEFGFGAFPHALTPGVRVFPLPALALDAAVRIGFADEPYPGVPATPPWMAVLGVAYTLDPRPQVVEREVVRTVAAPPPETAPAPAPPKDGVLRGRVVDARTGAPVAGARLEYLTGGHNPQLTDAEGRFTTYRLEPGNLRLRIAADGYASRDLIAKLEAGRESAVEVKLEPQARTTGRLAVRVVDPRGRARDATVVVGGEAALTGKIPAAGEFAADLAPGRYPLTVRADGFEPHEQRVEIRPGETTSLRVALERARPKPRARRRAAAPKPAPRRGKVALGERRIELGAPIRFAPGTADLTPASRALLDDVAGLLRAHPEVARVRIEAHTAGAEDRATLVRLSEEQARAVQAHLISRGVAPGRLRAVGRGPDRPLAPNLTQRDRERNRRVELWIEERR